MATQYGPLHVRRAMRRAIVGLLGIFIGATIASQSAVADDLSAQRLAVHQLVGSQLPSGLLEFDMDFFAGKGAGSGKSARDKTAFIARQAAAIYGIAKYYEQTKDESVRESLEKMIQALGDLSLPIGKSAPQHFIESTGALSLPFFRTKLQNALRDHSLLYTPSGDGALVAYEQGYVTAWAGTTSLALLAELHYFRATGNARFAPLRERWRNGLEVLHVPGKGFREYPNMIDEEPYADGESWLAFATFIDTFSTGSISAEEMRGVDDHMIATYSDAYNVGFFHWGAMAASRRFQTTRDRRFVDFAEKQAQAALAAAPPTDGPGNSCGVVEGLAANASTLAHGGHSDSALYRTLRARIRAEMDKNNTLQLQPDQDRITFGADNYLFAPRLGAYAGAYLMGRYTPNIRIDMTHHCVSAIAEMQSR